MRLRGTAALLAVAAGTTITAAFADKTSVKIVHPAPKVVREGSTWITELKISRRGRSLDGFQPVLEIQDELGRHTFVGTELKPGLYRVRVVFPRIGPWRYSVTVGRQHVSGGSLRVIPK
jgi:hypothetical protein